MEAVSCTMSDGAATELLEASETPVIASKVKVKQDIVSCPDQVAKDIKSRLNLINNSEQHCNTTPVDGTRQSDGIHQVNGNYESPPAEQNSPIVDINTATSNHEPETKNVDASHVNESDENELTKQATHPLALLRYLFEFGIELPKEDGAYQMNKNSDIEYVSYTSELQMPDIMKLIQKDLSEPYSIYTYRYFIHNWPKLCFLAMDGKECIGAIVCKLDIHRKVMKRGYIAMLAVDVKYRKRKIGSNLVRRAIQAMMEDDADEVVLETEITNHPALRLYENLGFVRDKRLFRYYLNGVDALRLKLWLR